MEARFKPIRSLFGRRGAQFEVPEYQRGYEWDEKNFEDLWADLQRIGGRVNKHYLGNIILLGEEGAEKFEIVDGQQRMVTISILMMAIRDCENVPDREDKRIDDIINCYPSNEVRRRLHLHDEDCDRYFQNLWEKDSTNIGGKIEKAYDFYSRKLSSLNEEEISELLSNVVEDLRVVETISQDNSLAYMIFQSQNERGLEVNPEVLIKARVFGEAERLDSPADEREVKGRWKQFYRRLNDELDSPRLSESYRIRRPLTQILLNSDVTTPTEIDKSALYRTFDETLQDYNDIKELVKWFNSELDIYMEITSSDYNVRARDLSQDTRRHVQYFNTASSHAETLSLSILEHTEKKERLKENFRLAATLAMRMMLAGYRSSERKKAVHGASREIRRGGEVRESIIEQINEAGPTNAEIEEHLKANNMTIRGQWRFRTLLTLVAIEEERRGPLRMELDNLHIEHIAPRNTFGEGRNSYSAWKRILDEEEFSDVKDTIGNLVLLEPSDHARLDESSFTSKRNVYSNSDIKMAEEVSMYDEWDVDNIIDRSEHLANELATKWSI
jgi:hypothetical protein